MQCGKSLVCQEKKKVCGLQKGILLSLEFNNTFANLIEKMQSMLNFK